MKTMSAWLTAIVGITAVLSIVACNKNNSSNSNPNIPKGESQLSVYMTDAPVQYDSVLVNIQQVCGGSGYVYKTKRSRRRASVG